MSFSHERDYVPAVGDEVGKGEVKPQVGGSAGAHQLNEALCIPTLLKRLGFKQTFIILMNVLERGIGAVRPVRRRPARASSNDPK